MRYLVFITACVACIAVIGLVVACNGQQPAGSQPTSTSSDSTHQLSLEEREQVMAVFRADLALALQAYCMAEEEFRSAEDFSTAAAEVNKETRSPEAADFARAAAAVLSETADKRCSVIADLITKLRDDLKTTTRMIAFLENELEQCRSPK